MTWQLEHTITWDPAGDAETQCDTALKYFFDTWLPSKGWTTSPRSGQTTASTIRLVQRNFTDIWTNTAAKHYLWFSFSSASGACQQYEDATYTTTPGDLGTDTTNASNFYWHSTSETFGQKNFKFWGSTENSNSFMVTRWDTILAWDPGINWPLFRPNAGLAAAETANVDMWQNQLFIPMNESTVSMGFFRSTNLPVYTNTNAVEGTVYVCTGMSTNTAGGDGGLWDKVEFRIQSNNSMSVIWDQADVKTYMYGPMSDTYCTQKFIPVQVNNGNYWLFTKGNLSKTQMAFDLGATLPNFD